MEVIWHWSRKTAGKPALLPWERLDGGAVFGLDQAAWVVVGGNVMEADVAGEGAEEGQGRDWRVTSGRTLKS
jgi:hypothetical protein